MCGEAELHVLMHNRVLVIHKCEYSRGCDFAEGVWQSGSTVRWGSVNKVNISTYIDLI